MVAAVVLVGQVVGIGAARAADTVPPDATVTVPSLDQALPSDAVNLSGSATDDVDVAAVHVALRNRDTGLWLNASGTFGSAFTWHPATLSAPGTTSTGWTWSWTAAAEGNFGILVRATDGAGNIDPTKPWVPFTVVAPGGTPDTTPPNVEVGLPAPNQSLPAGAITLTGTATDDVGVASVDIAIRDRTTGSWLRSDGTWGAFAWLPAQLSAPGTVATDWSFAWTSAPAGDFAVQARATDGAGNIDPTKPWVPFVVTSGGGGGSDTTPPDGTVTVPTELEDLTAGIVQLAGTATDDVGVAAVDVAIYDRDTATWYRSNGTWGAFQWHGSTLEAAGAPSTGWSFAWSQPAAGNWALQVRARDAAGNVDPTKPWVRFTTSLPPVGGTPPTYVATWGGPRHNTMHPSGVEVAPDGSLFVADTGNNQIKKWAPDGTLLWNVGTFGAGVNEFNNPRDVAVDANGDVYAVDTRNHRIVKLDGATGNWISAWSGPASNTISWPMGGTITDGKLYIADTAKNRVRVWDITAPTWVELAAFQANNGCASYSGIRDAEADAAGNIYLAGYSTNKIYKLTPTGDCLLAESWGSTGSGPGQFRTPYGVRTAVDPVWAREVLYVADAINNRVQVFELDGTFLAELGTAGALTDEGTFYNLRRVAVAADGDVWGADLWGLTLERFDRTPTGYTWAQRIGDFPAPDTNTSVFHEVRQLAPKPGGGFYAMDTVHHRFVELDASGGVVGSCGERGGHFGGYNWPRGIAIASNGELWTADTKANRIQVMTQACAFVAPKIGEFGRNVGQFDWPSGLAIQQTATRELVWVADTRNHRIQVIDAATREFVSSMGNWQQRSGAPGTFHVPLGIAIDPTTGNVLVADSENNRIAVISHTNGTNLTWVGAFTGGFNRPEGVFVDETGRIWVADTGDHEIVVLNPDGTTAFTFSGPTPLLYPSDVLVTATHVYVSDTYNDRIQVFQR